MSVWREASWESLESGADADPRWAEYGEYARLRAAGLRDQALEAADQAARDLAIADEATRWAFTAWIFTDILKDGTVRSMVLPHPLEAVALATLWNAHAAGDPHAARWLARWFPTEVMASRDYATDAVGDFLREVVRASPQDKDLRAMLASHLITWVRSDTADLAHDRYDGDPAADLRRLDEAEGLLDAGGPELAALANLRASITDWVARQPP